MSATFFVAMATPEKSIEATWLAFGQWIRETRERKNWTQERCAEKAGMKRQQWNRIESGASTKRVTVLRIAAALEVDAALALDKAGYKDTTKPTRPPHTETIEDALRFAQYFDAKGLSDQDVALIRPILDALDQQVRELKK